MAMLTRCRQSCAGPHFCELSPAEAAHSVSGGSRRMGRRFPAELQRQNPPKNRMRFAYVVPGVKRSLYNTTTSCWCVSLFEQSDGSVRRSPISFLWLED